MAYNKVGEVSEKRQGNTVVKNADSEILEMAFLAYSLDGNLTAEGRKKIEEIDKILEGADIIVSKDGKTATIGVNGQHYTIGFMNKPKPPETVKDRLNLPQNGIGNGWLPGETILKTAYKKLSSDADGLTEADRLKIEKIDDLFSNIDITMSNDGGDVSIFGPKGIVYEKQSPKSR